MIFNIQRYSTHDGPGIRTVIFMKGCSLSCRWCQNPESRSDKKQIMFDKRLCLDNCQLCVNCCPHAISRNPSSAPLVIHREALTEQDYDVLNQCCPTQALTVWGKPFELDDVMAQVLKDSAFYQRTGGGVTVSGGEPFMQPKVTGLLLKTCKDHNLHTTVETCLHVPWHYIEPHIDNIDLFLADLKHIDDSLFYQWTNGSAKRVMDNFRRLAKTDKQIIVRVPLIPEFNANEQAIKQITDFAADEVGVKEIHFLPYHILGANKYDLLGMPYTAPAQPLNDPDLFHFAQTYASSKGITAILRG